MTELEETPVVTCFLRNRGDVLLLRRSEEVGSYRSRWGAVAGHVEDDPDASARREIAEESGLLEACTLVRRGASFPVEDAQLGKRWVVHPYLFDCSTRDASLDWESFEAEWVPPTEILRRATVPQLWTSWRRVAPTVASIGADRDHGSAWLSLRALEVLRDAAAEAREAGSGDAGVEARSGRPGESEPQRRGAGDPVRRHAGRDAPWPWAEVADLARALLDARPAMTALHNRVHRVMHGAEGDAAALVDGAQQAIARAANADERAAAAAAERIEGAHVLTLSHSGTVLEALLAAECRVTVAASHPLGEGVRLAERLAAQGREVRICPDASVAFALHEGSVDVVLVGADAIRPDGAVVNKVGTHPAALAAAAAGVPVWAVAARDKIEAAPEGGERDVPVEGLRAERTDVYAGDAELGVIDALLEVTPAARFAGVVTETGVLDVEDIRSVAAEHRQLRTWLDR